MQILVSKKGEESFIITFQYGQNSLGEPGWFLNKPPTGYASLKGHPDYAVQQHIISRGWTYKYI